MATDTPAPIRVFRDDGHWNQDALSKAQVVHGPLRSVFDALEAQGFNPREAGAMIHELVWEETVSRMLDRRHAHVG